MNWPQYVYLGLMVLGLGVALAKHGESQGVYNFGVSLVSNAIVLWLLWMGGFFS